MIKKFSVDEDIRKAFTLSTTFYTNPSIFEISKEKIFAATWQYVSDSDVVSENGSVCPFSFEANNLNIPELENEAVVGSVQKGIQSRNHKKEGFLSSMEKAVHHFHRLIAFFGW